MTRPADFVALGVPGRGRLIVLDAELSAAAAASVRKRAGVVRELSGARMRTDEGLFAEFARGLAFPEYFGHNWPALEDCLIDLAWLPAPAYLIMIEEAQSVLADEPDERVGLLGDLLGRVGAYWNSPVSDGQWWDRPPLPFHVALVVPGTRRAPLIDRWLRAGVELDQLG